MAAELDDLRASFVYVESILEGLTGEVTQPPYTFIVDRFAFAKQFDESNIARGGDVEPPWPSGGGRSFWSYYYDQTPLDAVDGQLAWRGVTPFRHRFPLAVVKPAQVSLSPDAFVFSHGVAVVLTLKVSGPLTLEQAASLLHDVRRRQVFQIDLESGVLSLDALASRALTALRLAAFGSKPKPGRRPPVPFSIVTVIRGSNVAPMTAIAQGGDEQRFLDAVTAWSPNWQDAQLPPLDIVKLNIRTTGTPAGHLLYGRDRGRAVWFPGSFTLPGGQVRTLTCFHRNLVLASLQVDSLATFATATAQMLNAGAELTDAHFDAARRATDVLGRFYGATQSIYRSRSPRAQLDQGRFVADVNAVRAAVERPALFAPA